MRPTNAALEPRRSSPWMISKAKNVADKSVSWMISGSKAVEGATSKEERLRVGEVLETQVR